MKLPCTHQLEISLRDESSFSLPKKKRKKRKGIQRSLGLSHTRHYTYTHTHPPLLHIFLRFLITQILPTSTQTLATAFFFPLFFFSLIAPHATTTLTVHTRHTQTHPLTFALVLLPRLLPPVFFLHPFLRRTKQTFFFFLSTLSQRFTDAGVPSGPTAFCSPGRDRKFQLSFRPASVVNTVQEHSSSLRLK